MTRGSKRGKRTADEKSHSPSDVTPVTTTDEAQDRVPAHTETAKTATSADRGIGAKPHVSNPSIIEFSTDLNDQEAPPPLPEGNYPAEIRGAEVKDSALGNKYLSVQFYISPDAYPADFADGDPDGMTLSYNRIMVADKPQARYRLKKFLLAVGAQLGSSFDPSTLMGLTTTVHVKVGTWEGEPRSEIDKIVG